MLEEKRNKVDTLKDKIKKKYFEESIKPSRKVFYVWEFDIRYNYEKTYEYIASLVRDSQM